MNDSDNGDSNIYSGLPEFRYDETLDKLHATVAKLEAENGELQRKLDLMKKDKESLESNFKILSTNLSSLLKTARIEVSRKDRTIDDLRKQLHEVLPQRKRYYPKRKNDNAVDVTPRKRFCNESDRSSYYNRKPEFLVEDVAKQTPKSADNVEKPKLRVSRTGGYYDPTPRSAVRAVEPWPSSSEKPLPVKDVPLTEDGNCLPPPLNCPTVFSARMYRRMYKCSTGVAPDPPIQIPVASDSPVEARDKPVLNERLSPLLPKEATTKLPCVNDGDHPSSVSKAQLSSLKTTSSIAQPKTCSKDQSCANMGDKNSDMNDLVQPSTLSDAQFSRPVEKNVESSLEVENCCTSVVESELGRSQSELTFSVHSQSAGLSVNEQEIRDSSKLPNPPTVHENLCHFDVKADLRLSDSECSLSNPTPDRVPPLNKSSGHPVAKEPKNAKLKELLKDRQLLDIRRRKIVGTNRKTGLKKILSCPKKSIAKSATPTSARLNAKLKFTPISSSWVRSISSKNDALEEPTHPEPSGEVQKVNGLPSISVTSELMVTIDEPVINETREELLFGSPLKWTEDSCESVKRDDQQASKELKICSIFGSPLKIVDSGSSDRLNFIIPQNAYEESCWSMPSLQMKDSRSSKTSLSTQESSPPVSEDLGKHSVENPNSGVKSIFSPSKSSISPVRPVASKMGDQAESSLGLCFPFKSGPKYGDSVLGHYDDTAQFVSALAKDQNELSPLSTPSKSHNAIFAHPSSSTKGVPSSFKEIFDSNNCKVNEIVQPSQNTPEAPCEELTEDCPKNDKNQGDAPQNPRGCVTDQALSNCNSGIVENSVSSLSSSITLRMIPPANLASSSVLCPTQSSSTAPVNRLEPRKTPRIVVRSSNVALKNIETDIPKIALDDEFIAQQEKRWMNSCRSSKKSSGRHSVLAASSSPKKGYKATVSPLVDADEKRANDFNPEPTEKAVPISVDIHPLSDKEVSSLTVNIKECEAAISKVQEPNVGESFVENPEAPQNRTSNETPNSQTNKETLVANLESTECSIQLNGSLVGSSTETHVSPQEQRLDLKTKNLQPSANQESSNIDPSVARADATVSIPSVQPEASEGKMDVIVTEAKRSNLHQKPKEPVRGGVKVLTKCKYNNLIALVESPGRLNTSRETSILNPLVSSANVPGRIVIQKPRRRNKDFKKSSAFKETPQRRSTRLADLPNVSRVEEIPTPSSKPRPRMELSVSQGKSRFRTFRRKSEPDFNSKPDNREEYPHLNGGGPSRSIFTKSGLIRRKSENDLGSRTKEKGLKNYPSKCPKTTSPLNPLHNQKTSKRESESITSELKHPLKSRRMEKSESECISQTIASEVSRIERSDSSGMLASKRSKRVWRKSETHSTSMHRSEETCRTRKRSDEVTLPKHVIFQRKSTDCNFSSKTSESVSIQHSKNSEIRKHVLGNPVSQKQGQSAVWPPRPIDLETVGNIYQCIASSFSPDDPRACRELKKWQKPIVHVCGIDWSPVVEEKKVSSAPLVAKSPKPLDLDLSVISPARKESSARRAIAVVTSTPINQMQDGNPQKSPFARRKPFGHPVELNSGKPPSNMRVMRDLELSMRTRNRGRRTIMLSSPLERRSGKSPREKCPSPALSGSPKENYTARLQKVKKTRKILTDKPKSLQELVETPKKSPSTQEKASRLSAKEAPVSEQKELQTSPSGNPPKPKIISLKPRNINFSSFSASSSSSKVIYVGRNEASFRSND